MPATKGCMNLFVAGSRGFDAKDSSEWEARKKMTAPATPNDKGLRILLEALTTISYLKGGDGRAAAIAEYALDQYGKAIRNAKTPECVSETLLFADHYPEQRSSHGRRRIDRREVNSGPRSGQAERRLNADRRVNPDRRRNQLMSGEQ